MRKLLLYLLISFVSIGVKAQDYDWRVLSTAGRGLFTSSSNTYSVAYFKGGVITGSAIPVGPRVYVATREATSLDVLDAGTGSLVKTIATASAGYKNTRIRATETGEIYSVDLNLGSSTNSSDGKVITGSYMLDENSTAVAISFPYPAGLTGYPRMGDSFDMVGSGANATFFIGGSGSSFVYIYKRNGSAIDFVRSVDLGGPIAATSISIIPNVADLANSDFIVSANTTSEPRKIFRYNTGTYTATTFPARVHDQTAGNNFSQLKYFNIAGQGYIATTGGSTESAKNIKIFKIVGSDYSVNATFELVTTLSGGTYTYVSGNSGFSDLVFSKNIVQAADISGSSYEFKMYQLVTKNAIAAYTVQFDPAGTLPVTISSFNASVINNQNALRWVTSSENNSFGFEIESSVDGVKFDKIGFAASKGVNGNSNSILSYSFQDNTAASGITYYRLKQIDLNGAVQYSGVKAIDNKLQNTAGFSVYPNPATNYVDIDGADAAGVKVQLFATTGTEIETSTLLQGKRLDMSGLNTGVYVVRISQNGILVKSIKLIKN